MQSNKQAQREEIEVDLLCEGIFRHYGFDFRQYARGSLKRRIKNLMDLEGLATISALQELVLHDKQMMERFILNLSINVTAMFRDPGMFAAFRKEVVPLLKTYPSIRIWHAGCASGEEAFSMAILLEEEGLLGKSKIYATDINEVMIKKAKTGIFPMEVVPEYTGNYQKAGGSQSFSHYYTAKYDYARLRPELLKHIVFSKHNLVTDHSFNEFNVIFCRNVMIYFNSQLQSQVHQLMYDSLYRFGILVLGTKESVQFTGQQASYKELDHTFRIYQRCS
ncbi:CheR family methyltransferase [Thalassomonas haliotis]|uniref:Protein-glutamate O-methyltransferase CheR n=1 Tax=Thalassomonas haliotis TaxID=485448 RepID=A0ABY7V7U1_9GAMM|nr:protein-glutamate O-methyltransferase CheR [Thalassomonas haliotis]WDE09703.1 protein-glutamate O-methyltransferase CheR [Thalassomonas haliotis]